MKYKFYPTIPLKKGPLTEAELTQIDNIVEESVENGCTLYDLVEACKEALIRVKTEYLKSRAEFYMQKGIDMLRRTKKLFKNIAQPVDQIENQLNQEIDEFDKTKVIEFFRAWTGVESLENVRSVLRGEEIDPNLEPKEAQES